MVGGDVSRQLIKTKACARRGYSVGGLELSPRAVWSRKRTRAGSRQPRVMNDFHGNYHRIFLTSVPTKVWI